jgi:hypothetical protein
MMCMTPPQRVTSRPVSLVRIWRRFPMTDDPPQTSSATELKDPPADQGWLEVENVRSDSTTDGNPSGERPR